MRPVSIVRFEQAYLASILLWVVNLVLGGWQGMIRQLETHPAFAGNPQMMESGQTMLMGFILFMIALWLLIWFFTARKASRIAKWAAVIVAGVAVLRTPVVLLGASATGGIGVVLNLGAIALCVYGVAMLFRIDARQWLGENIDDDGDDAHDPAVPGE